MSVTFALAGCGKSRACFERARLRAAPISKPTDLRHGRRPCPFKACRISEFLRKLLDGGQMRFCDAVVP